MALGLASGCASLLGGDDGPAVTSDASGGDSDAAPLAPDADPLAPDAAPPADAAPLVDAAVGTLALDAFAPVRLSRDATFDVDVEVSYGGGVTGNAVITVTGLPSGVTAAPLTLTAGAPSGVLRLTAIATATLGDASPVVRAAIAGGPSAMRALPLTVFQPSGQIDVSWGQRGVITIPSTHATQGRFVVDADGVRVLTVHATANGLYHFAFDPEGVALGEPTYVYSQINYVSDMVRRADGEIVAGFGVAWTTSFLDVIRLDAVVESFGWYLGGSYMTTALIAWNDGWVSVLRGANGAFLRRANAQGVADPSWPTTPDMNEIFALGGSGTALYAGGYTTVGGSKSFLGQYGAAGQLVKQLIAAPATNEYVAALVAKPDGVIAALAVGTTTPLVIREFAKDTGAVRRTFANVPELSNRAAMARMADGRVLVASRHHLARFLPDGSLDADFGEGGLVEIASGSLNAASALVLYGDAAYVAYSTPDLRGLKIVRVTNA